MRLTLFRYFLFLRLNFFGLGNALAVKVKFLGLHPWEVLNMALYQKFGWTIGTWSVICGLCLVLLSLLVDRKYINVGTFLNALLIGPIMDFFLQSNILPNASDYLWINLLILFSGIAITGIGEVCMLQLELELDLVMDSCLLFPTKQDYLLAVLESL